MSRDPGEDFPAVGGLVLAWMAVPPVVVALAPDNHALPVTGRTLVVVAAAGFGCLAWALVEYRSLDRVTLVMAAIVDPWPVLLAAIYAVLLVNQGEQIPRGPAAAVFRALLRNVADLIVYGATVGLAGIVAVGVPAAFQR